MNANPDLYRRWVEAVRQRFRPDIERHLAYLRAEGERLQTALDRPQNPPLSPETEKELIAECEQLTAEVRQLERQLEVVLKGLAEQRRQTLERLLDKADLLLEASEAVGWLQTTAAADAILPLPGKSYKNVPVSDLVGLSRDTRAAAERSRLLDDITDAAHKVAGEADVLQQIHQHRQELLVQQNEIRELGRYLSVSQGVADEVLAALPALSADRSLIEFLERVARDARIEADWNLPRDVFHEIRVG